MDVKEALRSGVQAVLALGLAACVSYLTIVDKMDAAIVAGLAGMAIAFYFAEQKNGHEREHTENMARLKSRRGGGEDYA